MEDFLPTLPVLLAFTGAAVLLAVTPGPDMTLLLARTLAHGRRAGLMTLLGTCTGTVVHTLLAVAGVSALLVAAPTAFWALKLAGALYLLWLAIDAVRNGSALSLDDAPRRRNGAFRNFATSLGVNLLNPKIVIFFMTFLPQFVSADEPNAPKVMLFLGLLFPVIAFPIMVAMILFAERFAQALQQRPVVGRAIDWLFAGVFTAFAVRILFAQAD